MYTCSMLNAPSIAMSVVHHIAGVTGMSGAYFGQTNDVCSVGCYLKLDL